MPSRCSAIVLALLTAALLAASGAPHGVIAASSACGLENVARVVAVGDAHGAYDRYVGILRASGLIDDRQRWSGGRAHLVQVGDLVDRGAGARRILDLLRRLEKEAASANGAVHVLLGNHEVMRMLGDLRYVSAGEYQAFATKDSERLRRDLAEAAPPERQAVIAALPLGSIEMQRAFGPRGDYGRWLRGLNVVARINGVVFLHGGISPAIAAMSCDEINETVRQELTATAAAPATPAMLMTREDGPLWYRGLAQEPDEFASTVDQILDAQHARAIVVGHTVSPTGRIRPRFGGKVFQIDTGMQPDYVTNGRASALEIADGTFTAIYDDRRDPLGVPAISAP